MDIDHSDPIDLSKLTSLKRFAVQLRVSYVIDYTAFPWFNRILLRKDPLPQQLEEMSIILPSYYQEDDFLPCLKDTFDILFDD